MSSNQSVGDVDATVYVSSHLSSHSVSRLTPFDRRHLTCDDCLEDTSEDYQKIQNCSVLYGVPQLYTNAHKHTHSYMSSSYRGTSYQGLLVIQVQLTVLCVFYLPRASLFILCFWCIFSLVWVELSVPEQVIALVGILSPSRFTCHLTHNSSVGQFEDKSPN